MNSIIFNHKHGDEFVVHLGLNKGYVSGALLDEAEKFLDNSLSRKIRIKEDVNGVLRMPGYLSVTSGAVVYDGDFMSCVEKADKKML